MSLSPTITYHRYATDISIDGSYGVAVTNSEVKDVLPVYGDIDAVIIDRLIDSVQTRIEDYINIDATPRTRIAEWECPANVIELPYGSHGDIILVERYENKEWVATTDFEVLGLTYKRLRLAKIGKPIRVTFESGTSENKQVNQAILQEVSYQYKSRNDPNMETAETRSGLSVATLNILSGIPR